MAPLSSLREDFRQLLLSGVVLALFGTGLVTGGAVAGVNRSRLIEEV